MAVTGHASVAADTTTAIERVAWAAKAVATLVGVDSNCSYGIASPMFGIVVSNLLTTLQNIGGALSL